MIGVSRDTQEVSDHFRQSLDLPYPLVGDPDELITLAYKVRWPLVGLTRRTTFVIDARRTIRLVSHRGFNDPGLRLRPEEELIGPCPGPAAPLSAPRTDPPSPLPVGVPCPR